MEERTQGQTPGQMSEVPEITETADSEIKQSAAPDETRTAAPAAAKTGDRSEKRVETMAPAEALEHMGTAMGYLGEALGSLEAALSGVERSLENLYAARRAFNRIGLGAAVLLPVTFLVQILLGVVLNLTVPGWNQTWLLWVMAFGPLYCAAAPIALRIMGTVPPSPPEDHPLTPWQTASLVPVCLLLTYAGSAVSVAVLTLLNRLVGTSAENPLEEILTGDTAPVLRSLLMVWAAPAVEEFVFRRTVLDRLRRYGERLAIGVSALLFALVHGNLSQFCYALPLGLLFGYVYLRTGRLRYTIGLHVLVNFMGGVAAPLVLKLSEAAGGGTPDTLAGQAVTIAFGVLILLSCGGGVAVLVENWRTIHFVPAEGELPRGTWFRTAFVNPGMILMAVSCLCVFAMSLYL